MAVKTVRTAIAAILEDEKFTFLEKYKKYTIILYSPSPSVFLGVCLEAIQHRHSLELLCVQGLPRSWHAGRCVQLCAHHWS